MIWRFQIVEALAALLVVAGAARPAFAQPTVSAPQGVRASAGPVTREGVRVEVTWLPVEGATSYEVERAAGKPREWALLGMVSGTETASYVDQIWAPGGGYCYRVRAISGSARSKASEEACVVFGTIDYAPEGPDTGSGLEPDGAGTPLFAVGAALLGVGSLILLGGTLGAKRGKRRE